MLKTFILYHIVVFQDVEGMMSISVEAAAARESLSDDKEIVNTYEVVEFSSCAFQKFSEKVNVRCKT